MILTLALLICTTTAATAATPIMDKTRKARAVTDRVRDNKCLPDLHRRWTVPEIPVGLRGFVLRQERGRALRALRASRHRCLQRLSPTGIIRYVFPDSTEDAAIRVAYCESSLWPYARNPSGASGLFQLMPGHWRGRFNPFDAWANTRYAYRLSDAGTNWSAWVCSP